MYDLSTEAVAELVHDVGLSPYLLTGDDLKCCTSLITRLEN